MNKLFHLFIRYVFTKSNKANTNLSFSIFRAEILEEDKSLVIKNVAPADEGIYICEAHNSVGQISSKAQLVVNCE